MLLYKPVKSALDLNSLQEDIDVINNWVKRNHLMLNPSKCKSMLISRKRSPSQPLSLILDESPLEHVKTFKYLGVLLSSNLNWAPHVEATCAKARKLIGLLYRRFYEHVDSSHLVEMYKIVVRPHLEYAAPVWAPHLAKDVDNLENVQKFGLKMCMKSWDAGYQELLDLAKLPTLENRRLYLKLSTLYKILHGFFYFPSGVVVHHPSRSLPLLYQPFAHTNAYQSSFLPSTVHVWNHLPHYAHTAQSTHLFKFILHHSLKHVSIKPP